MAVLKRLLRPLKSYVDVTTGYCGKVGVLKLVRGKRGDGSFLIYSELVGARTGFDTKCEDLGRFVDSVCPKVGDRS